MRDEPAGELHPGARGPIEDEGTRIGGGHPDTSRAARRTRAGAVRLPDKIAVNCPPGTREAVEKAASGDGMATPDWLRRLVRNGIDAARKRRERAKRAR